MNDYAPLLLVLLAFFVISAFGYFCYWHRTRPRNVQLEIHSDGRVTGSFDRHFDSREELVDPWAPAITEEDLKVLKARPVVHSTPFSPVTPDNVKDWIENDPLAKELQALHRSKVMAVSNFRQEVGIIKFDVDVVGVSEVTVNSSGKLEFDDTPGCGFGSPAGELGEGRPFKPARPREVVDDG